MSSHFPQGIPTLTSIFDANVLGKGNEERKRKENGENAEGYVDLVGRHGDRDFPVVRDGARMGNERKGDRVEGTEDQSEIAESAILI